MGSGAMIYIPSFVKIGSGIQKLIRGDTHRQHGDLISLLLFWILVREPEGKRPLGRQRYRCVNDIKMDLREVGMGDKDWIDLSQERGQWRALVNTVMNHQVPLNAGKFLNSSTSGGF
jgi:hypothetical protein